MTHFRFALRGMTPKLFGKLRDSGAASWGYKGLNTKRERMAVWPEWERVPVEIFREVFLAFAATQRQTAAAGLTQASAEQLATLRRQDLIPFFSYRIERVRLAAIRAVGLAAE